MAAALPAPLPLRLEHAGAGISFCTLQHPGRRMSHIDWSVELKKIDREFSGLPPEPSAEALRVRRASEQRARDRQRQQTAEFGVWMRLTVVMILVGSVNFWPYARTCGFGLYGFLAAAAAIVAGGLWIGVLTFRHRMARAHALALVVVLWGLVLTAKETLPRTGYARSDPLDPPRWTCIR